MTYLIDTDVVIDLLAGRMPTIRVVDTLYGEVAMSVISVGEYYEGIYRSRRVAEAEKKFELLVARTGVYEITYSIMRRCGWIRKILRDSGQLIPDFDIVIAATAIEHGLTLVTRNHRHFGRIEDLSLYRWPETAN